MSSKKDYIATAAILKAKRDLIDKIYHDEPKTRKAMLLVITELAKDFAAIYGADNPAFDRARFLAACGIT